MSAGDSENRLYAEGEKMTQEPYPAKKKKSPWIWVSLGCIGIVAILGIIAIIFFANFLKGPEFAKMRTAMEVTKALSTALPDIAVGMEKYVSEKGDYPTTLEELEGYATADALAKVKAEMKYTKPATDAPASTVVLSTGQMDFVQGTKQEIVMQKDFSYFQVNKSPLK